MHAIFASTVFALLTILPPAWAEPQREAEPLLRIYEAVPAPRDHDKAFTFDSDRPLLVISTVRESFLHGDGKGVAIALSSDDTNKLAEYTETHKGAYLLIKAADNAIAQLHITGPIEDGILTFHLGGEEAVAAKLRERLHLKP